MNQKMADFFSIFMGVRKTLIMLSLILVAVVFRLKNLVNGNELVELLKSTTIAFFAANSVERVGDTVKHYVSESSPQNDSVQIVSEEGTTSDGSEN